MYQPLEKDLKDVLETLDQLKRAIEHESKARIKLEAEKAGLARQLSEALAAERRQRCKASVGRAIAKRAQVATQPIIATYRELASLKRELAAAKKKSEDEKKIFEERIAFLQQENSRLKEEKEAALAAADFAKELGCHNSTNGDQVTSTAAVQSPPPPVSISQFGPAMHGPPMQSSIDPSLPWSFPSEPPSDLQASQSTNGNSLWTGSGQLAWNPPPVNLTSNRSRPRWRSTSRRPGSPVRPQYQPVAGFRTATQIMAQEKENSAPNSQSIQSRADSERSTSQSVTPKDVPTFQVSHSRADYKYADSQKKAPSAHVSQLQVDCKRTGSDKDTPSSEVGQSRADCEGTGIEEKTPSSQVSQSWADDCWQKTREEAPSSEVSHGQSYDGKRSLTPQSEDDCIIMDFIGEEPKKKSDLPTKTEPEVLEEIIPGENKSLATEETPKKSKKKRKMYMKPYGDDLIM